jgi:hypothetical protein
MFDIIFFFFKRKNDSFCNFSVQRNTLTFWCSHYVLFCSPVMVSVENTLWWVPLVNAKKPYNTCKDCVLCHYPNNFVKSVA